MAPHRAHSPASTGLPCPRHPGDLPARRGHPCPFIGILRTRRLHLLQPGACRDRPEAARPVRALGCKSDIGRSGAAGAALTKKKKV
jgi:hypothetical protein